MTAILLIVYASKRLVILKMRIKIAPNIQWWTESLSFPGNVIIESSCPSEEISMAHHSVHMMTHSQPVSNCFDSDSNAAAY